MPRRARQVILVVLGCVIVLGCVPAALAQTPVGTASSGEVFEVDGIKVPIAGLPSWPLLAGDVISTGKGPAILSFGDLGRVVLDKNSRVRIQPGPGPLAVRLLQGGLSVKEGSTGGLRVLALDESIAPPAGGEMMVALDGKKVVTGPDGSSKVQNGAKPRPTPTPTPTPPPPPSPK